MFDAERLLGKIVGEVIGGSSGGGDRSILENLASGGGLMTAIGLGMGAFEILRDQKKQQGATSPAGTPPPPPPPGGRPGGSPPPPPPVPPVPGGGSADLTRAAQQPDSEELARRMIRVMIAAAHADGVLDADEQEAILARLEKAELSEEEKRFLVRELDEPLTIEQLVEGISDPSVAGTMYMLAVSTITVDSDRERDWLDTLARRLQLGDDVKDFIEQQYGTR